MGRRWSSLWLSLQVLGEILLLVNQTGSSPADKTIRIGYLLQHSTRAGAINVAIERAQNDGLLRDYNFRYYCSVMYFYNSFCCRTNLSAIGQLGANHVVRQSRCAVSEIHGFSLKHEYMIQIDNSFAKVGCMFETLSSNVMYVSSG